MRTTATATKKQSSSATKKQPPAKKNSPGSRSLLRDANWQLLAPDEFEAITRANYEHPESRLILELFLQVNYLWHLSKYMQNRSAFIKSVDWVEVQLAAQSTIHKTLAQLLKGVDTAPWKKEDKPTRAPAAARLTKAR
jgi:hypothetical protein